jgi:hypothetical protein
MIADQDADVVCLQEVQSDAFEADIQPFFASRGYEALYKMKTREVGLQGKVDGCAVFFKKARLQLKSYYQLELNEVASAFLDGGEVVSQRGRDARDIERYNARAGGDLLGGLFALFKGYDTLSYAAIRAIESQIELENKRRQQALDLQKRLTEAQIEQMKARTKAIERSDALIKVDGAGLQPHLEAFMWEILRTIQVKVNQDGLEMLLGI